MSSMLYVLSRWAIRVRALVLVSWVVILAILGAGAMTVGTGLDNGVSIPGTESGDAMERLYATFPQVSGSSATVVVVAPDGQAVATGASADAIDQAVEAITKVPEVEAVTGLDDPNLPAQISEDGTSALITVQINAVGADVSAATKDGLRAAVDDLIEKLPEGYQAHLGGQLFATEFPGITTTEMLGVLVALVVLFFTLGTLIAAGLPLLIALVGVAASIFIIVAATSVATINSTTPLLSIMLGLAVGIDYSLFVVSRHRDNLKAGLSVTESISRALGTAGSAVVFAGVTVMIALLGLGVAGIPFLTVMGVAGALGVGLAVIVALTLLPALLSYAGLRILSKRERRSLDQPTNQAAPAGAETADGKHSAAKPNRFFDTWIRLVTRRPVLTIVILGAALIALALPATNLRLALPDAGSLPKNSDARISYDLVAEKFGEGFNGPLIVTAPIVTSTDPLGLMDDLADELRQLDGIADIPLSTPNETADTGIIQVIPEGGPHSEETTQLVYDIRAMHDSLQEDYGVSIAVTGMTAVGIDVSAKLGGALLPFALVVVGLSLVLLTIVFRSIAVPVTAAIGYLLSVLAAFGIVAAVFEYGILADLFGVTRIGPIINFMPIVTMGILFGLSMDYEVFLVSRMREDYVHTGKAKQSVRSGFLGSAKVVTAAAIIMVSVFAAFVPEGDMNLKPIALGLAAGVAIDAFVVRMMLIPAAMQLLGAAAWWMPRWLDRILPSFDIEGAGVLRQRHLKDWPGVQTTVAARDLQVGGRMIDMLVPSGDNLLIHSTSPTAAENLIYTIGGRLEPAGGTIKVAGYLLPERVGAVRRRVACLAPTDEQQLAAQIRRATSENAPIVAIFAGAQIEDFSALALVPPTTSIILGASSIPPLPPGNWQTLDLDTPDSHEGELP